MLHTATGLEAFIEVSDDNGVTWTRLPEYKPDIQAKECTAYVEAKTGQRFRMCLLDAQLQQRQEQFGVIYYFDGQKAASRAKRPDVVLKAIHGLEVDRQRQLPFIFGSLQTTNNEREAQTSGLDDLGELRIEVWRVVLGKPTGGNATQQKPAEAKYLEHRIKKRASHQVTLGPEESVRLGKNLACTYLDKDPLLQFRFRYMCEALLDLNGIKPFETTEADHSGAADSGSGAPQAVPSTVSANTSSATASSSRSGASRKRRNGYEIIDIDEDEATEVERLRAEVASLRKKVKTEVKAERLTGARGAVIDLSEE